MPDPGVIDHDRGLVDLLGLLRDESARAPFGRLPDERDFYFAVFVDAEGARELSAATSLVVEPGLLYAGESLNQSVRRLLTHDDIGRMTFMKNLAAMFRESWTLTATEHGDHLDDPGRTRLLEWMAAHLSATAASRRLEPDRRRVLAALDPPARVLGWDARDTPLRRLIREQRAVLDAG